MGWGSTYNEAEILGEGEQDAVAEVGGGCGPEGGDLGWVDYVGHVIEPWERRLSVFHAHFD